MVNPYEKCPIFENKHYLLRFIDYTDIPDLLLVYSDEKAVPFFNSDNCHGEDFHYTSVERMRGAIDGWQMEYQRQGFVRWTIIDKNTNHAIGTIELFNRRSDDYFNNCGLMRLDLRSDYEHTECIYEILSLITLPAFDLFDCKMIATKVPSFAAERRAAVEQLGFTASEEILTGGADGKSYKNYYVLQR